jgi:pyridoxamine 5'-phosphate oxidase
VTDRHHAFHTPVFGTGFSLRTVVLRRVEVEAQMLRCHTDWRSPKVAQIQAQPEVQWLFYDPVSKVQLRLRALACLHHLDEVAAEAWEQTALMSRRCYGTVAAPGSPLAEAGSGLATELLGRSPTVEESAPGWPNFAVIVTRVWELDWLYLCANGNRRAVFTRDGEAGWQQQWVVP